MNVLWFSSSHDGERCGAGRNATTLSHVLVAENQQGERNTADIGTKRVIAAVFPNFLETLKMEWRDGRRSLAVSAAFQLRRLGRFAIVL